MDKEKMNASGLRDETAYTAVKNIRREERRNLITEMKNLAERYGYKITGRIDLREIKEADGI